MKRQNTAIKYVLYARKSSEEKNRQLLSIPAQIEWGKEKSASMNIAVSVIFQDEKSAKAPYQRSEFSSLVEKIRDGEIQGIFSWKLDRLSRNPEETGVILGMVKRGEIKHIVTNEREYRPEDNAIISYVDFGMADQYVRDLGRNVKRGLLAKAKLGWCPTLAPPGYVNTRKAERGSNTIQKHPKLFDVMDRAQRLLLTGNYTVAEVIRRANKEWAAITGKPLPRSTWYAAFINPFYYRWFEYPKGSGNWYHGKHVPMRTEDEFNRIQAILGRTGRPRGSKRQFAFTGLMRCGSCGAMVTAEARSKHQKNGNTHNYVYYHCTKRVDPNCAERYVELNKLERQIDEYLAGLRISDSFKEWAIQFLYETRQREARGQATALSNLQNALAGVTKQIDHLILRYLSPENSDGGLVSNDEYKALKTQLLKRKTAIEIELRKHGQQKEEWIELCERTFNFARHAQTWFAEGSDEDKRAIFACLGSNLILKDENVAISLREPFKSIFEQRSKVEAEIDQVRTSKNGSNKGQTTQLWAECPILRGVADDVRTYWMTTKEPFHIPNLQQGPSLESTGAPSQGTSLV